ncbi:MAG: hypothetical protein IPG89_11025 [Bacteroidetes bacterium]|nr:hypothetical protein [Bacteroidota bacterium]
MAFVGALCKEKEGIDLLIKLPTSLLYRRCKCWRKTESDFWRNKNSIGTITQPKAVFVYTGIYWKHFLKRQIYNGTAEAYKMGLTVDKNIGNY